jgi:hypothetical protein
MTRKDLVGKTAIHILPARKDEKQILLLLTHSRILALQIRYDSFITSENLEKQIG